MSFESIKMEITGASRESRIGIRISGLNGVEISAEDGQKMLNRRKPTDNVWCTPRKEDDVCVFESGVQNGVVVGDIVCHILNENVKTDDVKYPRPSHADFVGRLTGVDVNGGGKFSGRMTALTCILGGIAKGILLKYGIRVNAYISKIGDIQLGSYEGNPVELFGVDEKLAEKLESSSFPVLNEENKEKAIQYILDAKEKGQVILEEICNDGNIRNLGDAPVEGTELAKINELSDEVDTIRDKVTVLRTSNNEIVDKVNTISATSEEISASTKEAAEMSNNNKAMLHDFADILSDLVNEIDNLKKM